MGPSQDMETFRTTLRNSRNIVAIAGAGLSAASGIPTFRGAGGLWRTFNAMELATPEAFEANPSRVWQFYHMRREAALRAQPNSAHLALASLCYPDILAQTLPNAKFTFITQNVDGLSTRALQMVPRQPEAQASPSIFEMHGRLFETLCTTCGARELNSDSPICEALRGTENLDRKETTIAEESLPRCRCCRGLLRPGVVWFGEMPIYLDEIDEAVSEADVALVIGTSSTVYPAAGYAGQVADNGGKVAVFNLDHSEGDEDADWLFLGPCEHTLPEALFGAGSAATQSL